MEVKDLNSKLNQKSPSNTTDNDLTKQLQTRFDALEKNFNLKDSELSIKIKKIIDLENTLGKTDTMFDYVIENVLNEMFKDWDNEHKNKFRSVMLKYKSD